LETNDRIPPPNNQINDFGINLPDTASQTAKDLSKRFVPGGDGSGGGPREKLVQMIGNIPFLPAKCARLGGKEYFLPSPLIFRFAVSLCDGWFLCFISFA
jgi:hypothetical protein